jgi:hypothetical protein
MALLAELLQIDVGPGRTVSGSSRRTFSCAAIFAVLIFALANIVCAIADPIRYIDPIGWSGIRQNYLVSKLPQIIEAKSNAGVLLLGSSLSLTPAIRCDDEIANRPERIDKWYTQLYLSKYTKAVYLQTRLSQLLKHNVSVQNASVPVSIVSDQSLILRRYLESKKVPNCVVVCTAPRDYIDPNCSADQTDTYRLLAKGIDPFEGNTQPHRVFSNKNMESLWLRASSLYRHRCEYQTIALQYWIEVANYWGAQILGKHWQYIKSGYREEPNVPKYVPARYSYGRKDTAHYRELYYPVRDEQYNRQMRALRELCALGREHQLPVILIEMPLSSENLSLLSNDFKKKLHSDIERTAKECGAAVYEPSAEIQFSPEDFEDSAHMSASGGFKFFDWLAAKLSKEKIIWQETPKSRCSS